MGLSPFSRCDDTSHRGYKCVPARTEDVFKECGLGNPNPNRYTIKRMERINRFVVAIIHYPDCHNYEGNKIVVFEGASVKELQSLKSLDPHFCDSPNHPSPVARFEPTERGWGYALSFCRNA